MDCFVLGLENGKVFGELTGEIAARREIGNYDPRCKPFVPKTEAPIRCARTAAGWTAIVTAYIPEEFNLYAPRLRVYIFDPKGRRAVVSDNLSQLNSFRAGRILATTEEFVEISSMGGHVDDVRAHVWLLPTTGAPKEVLDEVGLVARDQAAVPDRPHGLWISENAADTKEQRLRYWVWDGAAKMLRPMTVK